MTNNKIKQKINKINVKNAGIKAAIEFNHKYVHGYVSMERIRYLESLRVKVAQNEEKIKQLNQRLSS